MCFSMVQSELAAFVIAVSSLGFFKVFLIAPVFLFFFILDRAVLRAQ